MDLYTFSLILGGAGLLIMALQGIGGGHGDHGHGHGNTHAGHAHSADPHGHAHSDAHSHSHSHSHSGVSKALWSFASPRVWFSVLLGAGVAGRALRPVFDGGILLFIAALGLGIIFERALVRRLWNVAFRFASRPALSLESAIEDEAIAVTAFDRNGQGIVAIDLDGHVVQLLATLRADDRALGAAVRAGDRVRIADVARLPAVAVPAPAKK